MNYAVVDAFTFTKMINNGDKTVKVNTTKNYAVEYKKGDTILPAIFDLDNLEEAIKVQDMLKNKIA